MKKKTFEEGYKKGYKRAVKDFLEVIEFSEMCMKFFTLINEKSELDKRFMKNWEKAVEEKNDKVVEKLMGKELSYLKKRMEKEIGFKKGKWNQ